MSGLTEAVDALFKARPYEPIDAHELMAVGGFGGWRTRISECRRIYRLHGGDIKNVPGTRKLPSGKTIRTSHYRYLPKAA